MPRTDQEQLLITATGESNASVTDLLAELIKVTAVRSDMGTAGGQLAAELQQLNSVGQVQADAVTQNTQAVLENTVAHATSGGGSTLSSVGSTVWKVFRSGLGLSSIVSGLAGLFGGGEPAPLPPLPVYTRPPAIQFETTVASQRAGAASAPGQASSPAALTGPQVTVQVNAMDSRSFLDHSQEIARAVREAMLNSHSLNDVVSEL